MPTVRRAERTERPRYDPNDPIPNTQRIPPQAPEAERAVLGCLMTSYGDNARALKMARERLTASDFDMEPHRKVFEAIMRMSDAGAGGAPEGRIDPLSVADELARVGYLDYAGGLDMLRRYCSEVAVAASLPRYVASVRRAAGWRRCIKRCGEIIGLAYDGIPPEELAEQLKALAAEARLGGCRSGPTIETLTAEELGRNIYDPIRWAVPGLIPEGLTLLTGRSKIGKSFLVHGIAAGVAEGGTVLSSVPVEGGDVLYLALEDPERRLQSRHSQIARDGSWPARLHFATHAPTLNEGLIPALEEFLDGHPRTRLVILDTFGRARGESDEKGGVYWTEYRTLARVQEMAIRRSVAVVCTHHTNKLQETVDDFDPVSGSTGMQAACDAMILIKRRREESLAELVVTGREIKDERLALKWEEASGWSLLGDAETYFRTTEELDVLSILAGSEVPLTPDELAEELAVERKVAGKRLERMFERSLVKRTTKGYTASEVGLRALLAAGIRMSASDVAGVAGVAAGNPVAGVAASAGVGDTGDSGDTGDTGVIGDSKMRAADAQW